MNASRQMLHETRHWWVRQQLEKHAGNSILDVGCGMLPFLGTMNRAYCEVVLTDIAPRAGMVRTPVAYDVCTGPLHRTFEVILCSEVLEHVKEPARAIHSLAQMMEPNGTLILTTPQRGSPLELLNKALSICIVRRVVSRLYQEHVVHMTHINSMTPRKLTRLFKRAGLQIVEQHFCGLYVPVLAELGGGRWARIAQRLEPFIARVFRRLLWTQCYILKGGE